MPAALKQKYERAASLQGETFSGWAKNVLAEAADKQIREHEFLDMALKDRLAFAEAVLSPPQPTKAALAAAKRYKQSVPGLCESGIKLNRTELPRR